MKLHPGKRILALGCALVCALAFSGCQAVLDYVDNYVPPTTPAGSVTVPTTTGPNGETAPETTPAQTQPSQPTVVGVVTGAGVLNVRAGAGTEFEKVGSLEDGTKVAIYEQVQVGESTWGRIKIGWISMNYIQITDTGISESSTIDSIIATVTGENLNVRSGPGTGHDRVGSLTTGDKIQITEVRIVGESIWGKGAKGWVSMNYVQIDGMPNGELRLSGTVDTAELMIRSAPGAQNQHLGSYLQGEKVLITQLKSLDSQPWGKTDKGWICIDYVAVDGGIVVTAE